MGDHTETVDIDFDPSQTSYSDLLDVFWRNHDPTAKCSRQYMSAIFYHDEEQKRAAEQSMTRAADDEQRQNNRRKINTLILPIEHFTEAEDYHQKYILQQHGWLLTALDIDPGRDVIGSHAAARLNGYLGGYGKIAEFEEEWSKLGLNEKMADYVRRQMTRNPRGH